MSEQYERLLVVTDDDVPAFSYAGQTFPVKIVDVYDGDTFTGCFFENGALKKYKFRCEGYDSAEIRQKRDDPDRELNKKRACADRDYLSQLILAASGDTMVLSCAFGKFDKYGRVLVQLPADGSINRDMVASGHGYPYNGGTKRLA